ncbi:GNAT family N-acetyltransferase [Saccharopolyspora dendranthemae]|uniref:Ribosomal protein S18 acetylase RimI-like enzyme n=1 Tax=Saccharopolyspora dendranthemae TaxID=1181886 RepID=A0A561U3J3_9PSEU|nr:GNAT family N-acetyltransferase [Saccharopolyspora dendranthemae]TWF93933.1 ribosomal protein S18 acetylase RimI-like enzyme [Saccharopolyspora dendranthemae]
MSPHEALAGGEYVIRRARHEDVESARTLMFDTFYRVMGHGYVPEWHADVIDMHRAYFETPGHALFVAVLGTEVVGTASVRASGPQSPPHPQWIAERYGTPTTAQIFRTYVREEHQRRGIARALVEKSCEFVAETGRYDTIYLHTNPAIAGAEPFWRSVAKEVCDARGAGDFSPTIHFEIPVPPRDLPST